MPIVRTSDGYYATMGGQSQGPVATYEEASQRELEMAAMRSDQGLPPTSPKFPVVTLGPNRVPMRVTPAVMAPPPTGPFTASIGDAVIEPSQVQAEGYDLNGPVTIGDAVIEPPAAQARMAPGANRLLPKKNKPRPR